MAIYYGHVKDCEILGPKTSPLYLNVLGKSFILKAVHFTCGRFSRDAPRSYHEGLKFWQGTQLFSLRSKSFVTEP